MKRSKEPDAAEFISALAAGKNAQLMVVVCGASATPAALALVAASRQTSGRVVCIQHKAEDLHKLENDLGSYATHVEFVLGDAKTLLLREYKGADFVLIDCDLDDHRGVFLAAQRGAKNGSGGLVVGYNALNKGSSLGNCGFMTHFLPIGKGLLVCKVPKASNKRSRWVVKVDKCTGEEHVFRIRSAPETESKKITA